LTQLKDQLELMLQEKFNGITLFDASTNVGTATTDFDIGTNATSLTVVTSHDGDQFFDITRADLNFISDSVGIDAASGMDITTTANATTAVDTIQTAIQNLATLRANNGAEQSRLSFAADMLSINKINLEAANSRIVDVDVAAESSQLARFSILQQAGTAMLSQANMSTQSILRLLQ
jgi:flagellin